VTRRASPSRSIIESHWETDSPSPPRKRVARSALSGFRLELSDAPDVHSFDLDRPLTLEHRNAMVSISWELYAEVMRATLYGELNQLST
jgi:hypothetical protein